MLEQLEKNRDQYIISHFNNEAHINDYIDMHGMRKQMCLQTLAQKLADIQSQLNAGTLKPNYHNGRDHIFQIIAGAGHHSKGPAVLKHAVNSHLEAHGFDFYANLERGQFLVRLSKV